MKKRFAVIVLSLCMVLALIPTAAFAADGDTIHVGRVALTGTADAPAYALTDDSGSVTTGSADREDAVFQRNRRFDLPGRYDGSWRPG